MNVKLSDSNNDNNNNTNNSLWFIINFERSYFDCAGDNGSLKDALSGLRQLLATESPLKMMNNAFYITSKALLVLKIFKFLS